MDDAPGALATPFDDGAASAFAAASVCDASLSAPVAFAAASARYASACSPAPFPRGDLTCGVLSETSAAVFGASACSDPVAVVPPDDPACVGVSGRTSPSRIIFLHLCFMAFGLKSRRRLPTSWSRLMVIHRLPCRSTPP